MTEPTDTATEAPRTLTDAVKQTVRDSLARLRDGMPGFKDRKAQNVMIGAVARTLGSPKGVLVVEAGTVVVVAGALLVGLWHPMNSARERAETIRDLIRIRRLL